MEISTQCAVSGRPILIQLDNELRVISYDPLSDPMISVPRVNLLKTGEPSIVDVF